MQSIILPNHLAFLIETNEGNYFLGIPNEIKNTLEIVVDEKYQVDNLNALINLSHKTLNSFIIPIFPSIVFKMIEEEDQNMYREVFVRISKTVQHAEQSCEKNFEKPYIISSKTKLFSNYIEQQFNILEQIQKIREDKFDMQEILNNIPKASDELLAHKEEKEQLLALKGQLLNANKSYEESGNSKGKQKKLSTKEGKVYAGLDPNGFVNILLLCIISLYVTVGTMLAVIFTLR